MLFFSFLVLFSIQFYPNANERANRYPIRVDCYCVDARVGCLSVVCTEFSQVHVLCALDRRNLVKCCCRPLSPCVHLVQEDFNRWYYADYFLCAGFERVQKELGKEQSVAGLKHEPSAFSLSLLPKDNNGATASNARALIFPWLSDKKMVFPPLLLKNNVVKFQWFISSLFCFVRWNYIQNRITRSFVVYLSDVMHWII